MLAPPRLTWLGYLREPSHYYMTYTYSLIPLCEKANLRDILPERVEALREYLHSFVSHAGIVAKMREVCEMHVAETHALASHP